MKDRGSLLDAVIDGLEAAEARERKERATAGALPFIGDLARVPSMSLGTHRFCNSLPSTAPPTDLAAAVLGSEGSTPVACIEWNRITVYREPHERKGKRVQRIASMKNLTRGVFNGYMSPATRRKVRRPVSTWIRSMMLWRAEVKRKYDPGRAYPTFLTVTLPSRQVHTDAEITRACLGPFIQRLKRDYEIEHYFWRAEAQENGNVHYHLLVDKYIPKRYLQLAWNMSAEALGYLTRYFEESGSLTPPSTEVHRVTDKKRDPKTGKWRTVDPVDYLMEYVLDAPTMEKGDPNSPEDEQKPRKIIGRWRKADGSIIEYVTRPITGRVWGMADALREIREPRAEVSVDMAVTLEKAREAGILKRVDNERATMYFGPVSLVLGRAKREAWAVVKTYYLTVFGHLYPALLPPEYLDKHPQQDPHNLWIDLDHAAMYRRVKMEEEAPVFKTAQELDAWIAERERKGLGSSKAA